MKKRVSLILSLALALVLLTACGRGQGTPEVVNLTPAPTPVPVPTATAMPVPSFAPTQATVQTPMPTLFATPVPTLPPTPMPTPIPTPMPTPIHLPRVTKNPGDETVNAYGWCQFVTRYENAEIAEWHFVSPDGSLDATYKQVQNQFPALGIIGGNTKDMTLENIPEALNGCRVYCRFSNNWGSVDTATALLTVRPAQGVTVPTAPAARRQGFDGRWAEEVAGRCQIDIRYRAEGSFSVDINWAGSAWQRACWQMTANTYRDDMLVYDNAHYWVEGYIDEYNFAVTDERFDASGSFFLQDGKLHWYNEQTGEELVLVPA